MNKIINMSEFKKNKEISKKFKVKDCNDECENKYIKALKNTPKDVLKEMEELLEN